MFLTPETMDERTDQWQDEASAPDGATETAEAGVVVFLTLIEHGDLVVEPDTLF